MSVKVGVRIFLFGLALAVTGATLTALMHPSWTYLKTDEATYLASGVRMNHGHRIYLDYHEFIPPVMPLIHTSLYKTFGAKLLVFRFFALAAWTLAWGTLALVLFRNKKPVMLSSLACILGLWLYAYWPVSYHQWWGSLLVVLWCTAEWFLQRQKNFHAGFGLIWLVCLIALPYSSQTVCLIGFMGLLGALGWRFFYGPLPRWYRHLFIAACATHLLVFAVLAWTGRVSAMILDQILWPMWYYRQPGGFNDQSLMEDFRWRLEGGWGHPLPTWVMAAVLMAPFVLYFLVLLRTLLEFRKGNRESLWFLPALLTVPLVFWLGKMDTLHWIFLQPITLVSLAFLARGQRSNGSGITKKGLVIVSLVVGTLICLPSIQKWRQGFPEGWSQADRLVIPDETLEMANQLQAENGGFLPVLPRSGVFEFYGIDSPLPWSLVLPTEFKYQSSYEYAVCADRLLELKPKWFILYPYHEGASLLQDKTPLGFVLRQNFQPAYKKDNIMILQWKESESP